MPKFIAALLCTLAVAAAHGAQIVRMTPQGEVARVQQLTITFSDAVVPFGEPRLPDPAGLNCQGAAPGGSGRWTNDRSWVYDFSMPLPPGIRCTLALKADWKPLGGAAIAGKTSFQFSTGGPQIVSVQPYEGQEIAEDQYFLATLNGAAEPKSVAANAWCEADGVGEKIPVRIIDGDARAQLLKANSVAARDAPRMLLMACQRPLPGGAAMRLVWGKGIATAANSNVVTSIEQRFGYTVRAAFTADFTCEREKATAPCLPIRPLSLRFSAPVARDVAAQVRLKPASGDPIAPAFDKDDHANDVSQLTFPKPLPENMNFQVVLPPDLKDNSGRPLANASTFPLAVATGEAPAIAKFAAAPFGVVELNADAMLPLTLRHVQGDLRPAATTGQVRVKRLDTDRDILAWYAKLRRYDEATMTAKELGLPEKDWTTEEDDTDSKGRPIKRKVERSIATREISLLAKDAGAKRLALPQLDGGDPRPFEVVGIPLPQPGYQVVEIESQKLGAALLDKPAPMYVRTGVLVTNLGVHFKLGRENSLVWVTTLDRGKPVEAADVVVNDCRGEPLWKGRTDAQGLARVPLALDASFETCPADGGYFVTARKAGDKGVVDTAFVFSSWQKGIESWRFNQPTGRGAELDVRAQTVLDRTLLRAGETVSMKHYFRLETSSGLANAKPDALPTELKIVHQGSGQEYTQPLTWQANGRYAVSTWNIPPAAKLGVYNIVLVRNPDAEDDKHEWTTGDFRVEEFRLPLVNARVSGPKGPVVAPPGLALGVQLDYFSGGPMSDTPARASALLKTRSPSFAGYDEYSFDPPRDPAKQTSSDDDSNADSGERDAKLIADKLPLTTDKNGAATVTLKELPKIERPSAVTAEVTYNDPNGEVQTASTQIDLWPSAVVLGVKAGSWASARGKVKFTVVALDTAGKPLKSQSVDVRGRVTQVITTRKRLVGGFYAYDNRNEVKDLGKLCSGSTDDRGLLLCEADLDTAGQVELIASATDADRHPVSAAASVWVTKQGELWFAQDNDDRIDVLPEKKRYEPGETARLQVRMPFREATVLVSVEREGILDTRVVTLRGDDPTIDLKIEKTWGPNVYVSVLALRGRIREVPWYSFFTWGWKEPLNWVRSFWYEGREYQAPTAMVDLSKPAFKLGVAALKVGIAANTLDVKVTPDKASYQVRGKAMARVKVSFEGKPLAGAQVAFAAVDEGLLSLRSNDSWDLLGNMIQTRPWGVETSTAQSEIIGRRHYGRKAVAAGGGGGHSDTRELFDTLLVWKPEVTLDANGEAVVEVPLNDSLTSFRLVAVADAGTQQFGTGSASIKVTQDLQVLAGLPPLVRTGDRYSALVTLRNTTAHEMKVHATLQGTVVAPAGTSDLQRTPLTLPPQDVTIAAGGAREVVWPVVVPDDAISIAWEAGADEQGSGSAKDRVKITQLVTPAVPVRVLQATLEQLDGKFSMPVAAPAEALPASGVKLGGLSVGVQPSLTGALPGMRRFFETYPFVCLEQKTSKSVGLKDAKLWAGVANSLPTYLDSDGLASYFPPRADEPSHGSDTLTAYVLAATQEAGFELPPEARDAMLDGLTAFVAGRLERKFWAPAFAQALDLDVRKLAAIDALARYGRAQPAMLGSINLTPNTWPTHAVIDWLDILKRVDAIPNRAARIDEANQILRGRLTFSGTTLKFSTEDGDFWWWLMDNADVNAARLILTVLDDPAWQGDLPKMVVGSLGRQRKGAWLTTTANLWGSLALDKFAAKFEAEKPGGKSVAHVGDTTRTVVDWARQSDGAVATLPWPAVPNASLDVTQDGPGKPWLTIQSLAAIPLKEPIRAGYTVTRSISAVEQKDPDSAKTGIWSRGDVLKVHVEVQAQADMTWVVVSDPVPAGATILGSGLGRDSAIATQGERRQGMWPAFEERSFEAFRSYYDYLPAGKVVIEYTVRLNNPGRFALPPTRVEAMYAPESFGELPNAAVEVKP